MRQPESVSSVLLPLDTKYNNVVLINSSNCSIILACRNLGFGGLTEIGVTRVSFADGTHLVSVVCALDAPLQSRRGAAKI